ncbi:uncharacterized protein LOC129583632 [Paramacrobiotus metropolitanus]|uniref:uncharacterized protein LOC129583632 n=1 Tax=Paramacrobiotus metropolitanus TaxID=2943436 RepID=UPI0024458AA2|nr:uncharacterized protein LOC129583632 [Paramacrobiotus metropolitanus]
MLPEGFFNHPCLIIFALVQSVMPFSERERISRYKIPKYPPVIWFPEFPMFNNRTNPARIVVQMHDSLDFFCPDYINSQYQSFTGSKKHASPSDFYGAEEIYMVDGSDYQSCFSALTGGRLSRKHVRLLLRCPGKTAETGIKAKYQYTVSFRMFSPVPKGPEFNCNQEYYFLGTLPGHNHDEEMMEKALCSTQALRLQIFVSCSDIPSRHLLDSFSSPNVIQLDRPAQPLELQSDASTASSKIPSSSFKPDLSVRVTTTSTAVAAAASSPDEKSQPPRPADHVPSHRKSHSRGSSTKSPPGNGGLFIAASDKKIMRSEGNNNRHSTLRRQQQQQRHSTTVKPAAVFTIRSSPVDDSDQDDDFLSATTVANIPIQTTLKSKPSIKAPAAFFGSSSNSALRPRSVLLILCDAKYCINPLFALIIFFIWLNRV